eukprot:TRINITY_DN5555_c0_g1_i2.p1 TRINITY_DN5555_c0_g1~~TRINITY_DN5555_c0_g1_i2.p1  ORF type:complete len:303 (-),score=52.55 TRINITY_DN5555_c0_g1_i2:46-954(-)
MDECTNDTKDSTKTCKDAYFAMIPRDAMMKPICLQHYRTGRCRFKRCKLSHESPVFFHHCTETNRDARDESQRKRKDCADADVQSESVTFDEEYDGDSRRSGTQIKKDVKNSELSDGLDYSIVNRASEIQNVSDNIEKQSFESTCAIIARLVSSPTGEIHTYEEKIMKKAGAKYDMRTEKLSFPIKHENSIEKQQLKRMKTYHWEMKTKAWNNIVQGTEAYSLVVQRSRVDFHRFRPLVYFVIQKALQLPLRSAKHIIYAETLLALLQNESITPGECECRMVDWGFRESMVFFLINVISSED